MPALKYADKIPPTSHGHVLTTHVVGNCTQQVQIHGFNLEMPRYERGLPETGTLPHDAANDVLKPDETEDYGVLLDRDCQRPTRTDDMFIGQLILKLC